MWTVGRYLKRWGFTPQKPVLDNVRSYLRSTQKYPAVIINYFQEEHVSYAG